MRKAGRKGKKGEGLFNPSIIPRLLSVLASSTLHLNLCSPFSLGKDSEREVFLMSEVHLVFEQGGNCL